METDRLRYFCAIVDTGSLTKASELLGVSHSGLSKAMSVLQDELGFKILVPKGRGLELTERGKEIYEQCRRILELTGSLGRQTRAGENHLKIGLPEVLALSISESIMKELNSVTIEELDSGEIEARVLERKVDFAFTFVPFPHKEIDHLKITNVALHSYCRSNFFRGNDPETIPYVIPAIEMKDNPLSIKIRDGWNSKLNRATPYRANSLSIALQMVQSGACAIYAPSFLIACLNQSRPKEYQFIELEMSHHRRSNERTHRDIFLVKRHTDDESKIMKTIVRIVRQICKDK